MLLQMALFHSFLWLSNVPLYTYTSFSLSIHLLMDIYVASMWVIVNRVSVNTGVHASLQIIIFSKYTPGVGLLDHMVVLFLVF